MPMRNYLVTFISAEGETVKTETIQYDVSQHESADFIIPEARIKLVVDAPDFGPPLQGPLARHIEPGYLETVVIDEKTLLCCHESFLLKLEVGDWKVNTHDLAKRCAGIYGPQAAAAYGEPSYNPYPFAGPLVVIEDQG